jgi:hypothetical protein
MKNATELIETLINKIEAANSLQELQIIHSQYACEEWYIENRKDSMKYPTLNFSISQEEVQDLLKEGSIKQEGAYYILNMDQNAHPLIRLLYATLFKRGELLKITPIIKGILSSENVGDIEKAQILFQMSALINKFLYLKAAS